MENTEHPSPRHRWLKWSLLSVLGLVLLLAIGLFTLDLGFLRGSIEERVRAATGRDFVISGPLSIRLGGELTFQAEGIEFGNAEWAGPDPMALVGSLRGRIDTRSLFSDTVIVRELSLAKVRLNLLQDAEGRANWVLGADEQQAAGAPGVLLAQLTISDASLQLQSPRLDQPLAAEIEYFRQNETADGYLEPEIQATVNGRPLQFSGRIGPAERLAAGTNVSVNGKGMLGRTELRIEAEFDQLWAPEKPRLDLSLAGPELAELTAMLGIEGMGSGPLEMQLKAGPSADRLEILARGRLGELRLDATLALPSLTDTRDSQWTAQVEGPNFGRLARLAGFPGWPERPFTLDAQVQRPGTGLQIERLKLGVADARLDLSGQLPAFPAVTGAALKLTAEGRDIAPFEGGLGMSDLPRGAFRISGDVSANDDDSAGLSLEYRFPVASGSIAGTLGGDADLVGTDLRIEGRGSDARALGNSFGLPGLSPAPWTLGLGVAISEPGYYHLRDLAFASAGLEFQGGGRLDAALPKERFELDFRLSGPRLSDLQGLVGDTAELPTLPFRANGRVAAQGSLWRLQQVQGTAGETDFTLDGALGFDEGYAGTDLHVSARGANLDQLASLPPPARLPGGPFDLATRLTLGTDTLTLEGFTLNAGALSAKGDAALPWPLDDRGGRFNVEAHGQDVTRILPQLPGLTLKANAFEATLKGAWNAQLLSLDAANVRIGEARLSGEGKLSLPPSTAATKLNLQLQVPDLGKIAVTDGDAFSGLALGLELALAGDGKRLRADPFQARVGQNNVKGRLDINLEPATPVFELSLAAPALDLRPFQPEPVAGAPASPGARMIPELAWPMETLASAAGQFEIRTDLLILRQGAFGNVLLKGRVHEGALSVTESGLDGFKGRLTATLDLAPTNQGARLKARIQAQNFIINAEGLTTEQKSASPPWTADVQVEGSGIGLRETAATLSGTISLQSEGGRFYRKKKEGAKPSLFPAILAAIKPELARQDALNLACVAGRMGISQGRIALDPGLSAYTDKLRVQVVGSVNLANEQLDLSVRTQERQTGEQAAESFAPALKVSGTLAAHSIGLDQKGTLLSGSASFLKGGLSQLAKAALDQGGGQDLCAAMIREREKAEGVGSE